MGDEVRVTVIAAGFDRWDEHGDTAGRSAGLGASSSGSTSRRVLDEVDVFSSSSSSSDDLDLDSDDEFDVPSFLK
jgi:cell division protein FtsZ